ncbi:50S ribosomal protein L29 [Candidatus Pacearchaeota archaeon]|nr:50S ribosomal protein L29 [Candidatus Pacearchaeota archaeon]
MALLKIKDIKNISEEERNEKLKELRLELIKKYSPAHKASKTKAKEIKKAIARIITLKQ